MKFKVEVTVMAECTYTVEVDAPDSPDAEEAAVKLWRTALPDDFQVEKGYITDWDADAEAISWECNECHKEISKEEHRKNDELCDACQAEYKAEEARTA